MCVYGVCNITFFSRNASKKRVQLETESWNGLENIAIPTNITTEAVTDWNGCKDVLVRRYKSRSKQRKPCRRYLCVCVIYLLANIFFFSTQIEDKLKPADGLASRLLGMFKRTG